VATDPTAGSEVHAQILVTLACYESELGRPDVGLSLLDEALHVDPKSSAAVWTARGLVLLKSGDKGALNALDQAVRMLSGVTADTARPGAGPSDLASALLNRGVLHMVGGRLAAAQRDTMAAEEAAREAGRPGVVLMARHNLGYVRFLAGALPEALDAMATATEMAPEAMQGVPALDRAKVLMSAGLLVEAAEFVDEAISALRVNQAMPDLAEACLVKAEIQLLSRDGPGARKFARRAARIYQHRGNVPATLTARLLELRAEAALRASGQSGHRSLEPRRTPGARRRALTDAADAAALSADLASVGLVDQARVAGLFAAEALLDGGDLTAATDTVERAAIDASSSLATRLHTRLVSGRIELATGRRTSGLAQIRRGLDELADFQARFGSQDLQSAASIHGRELAVLGLRTAVSTGAPASILQWLERARAASTRLPAIRPPADPALAEELGALRVADEQARSALLAGKRDSMAERRVVELRRKVRARSWTVSGSGRADRPPSLAAVRRRLTERRPDAAVVALFVLGGNVHALVVTPRRADHLVLVKRDVVEGYLHRLQSDLDLLADERIPARLAKVAAGSMDASLGRLSDAFTPVVDVVGSGPLLIAAVGELATVPWLLLPCIDNRPVTVSSSVTRAVAGLGHTTEQAIEHGVLVVAGPEVTNGDKEASAIAALHRDAVLLTGPAATGHAVLDAIPSGGLVHIAAHGHHERGNPLFSGVKLADGLLFGYDFAPNPSLPGHVVLSSCDVGQTDERPGGEPLGLVAALVRSGVPTVVTGTSLIADSVAEATMVGYHELLLSGAAPAEALAAAVAAARADTGLPAPFSCFGAGL
jgi:tetratricopeptide (TPR) repeat protein